MNGVVQSLLKKKKKTTTTTTTTTTIIIINIIIILELRHGLPTLYGYKMQLEVSKCEDH